jgi:carboxyl-terminal processing protease
MQKIATFIMSKKFLPIMLVLVCASLFIAFKTQGRTENSSDAENPRLRYSKVIKNVGILLEEGHFSPRKIDDDFSKIVFKRFVEELDDEKNIFFQSDIDALKKYENSIDDEIHGAELKSFFEIHDLYTKRLNEASILYKELLNKPFDFSVKETIEVDAEKLTFTTTDAERQDRWRKRIKLMVLGKYAELLEQKNKPNAKKEVAQKADTTLEREARDAVRKQMDRYTTTKKSRETMDENFSVFVNDIAGTMDPHTDYFAPIDMRGFNEQMKGSFYGIGAQIKEEEGKIKLGPIMVGMPAWRNGELKENDEVLKIAQGKDEPVDVTGYAVADAIKLIRGAEKGSEVRLTVKKVDGSIKVVSLLRDEIKLEDTFAKSVVIGDGDDKIGYISLPEFYADFQDPNGRRCAADVAKEIEKLKKENVKGIVIDLRDNGGGSLYDVVQMAGLFIEDGPMVQVKSRGENPTILRDRDKSVQYTGPLAVLVNERSASASEIFAAAIQDYKRGIIIGSTSSYGKGTVQRAIPLNPEGESKIFGGSKSEDLGSLKLTLQKFYRVNGGATQLKGVTPDVVLPDGMEHYKFREKDNKYALKWDEIPQAEYKPWVNTTEFNSVIANANTETAKNDNFNKIKLNTEWLQKNADKQFSLNLKEYTFEQAQIQSVSKEMMSGYKLLKPLDVKNVVSDTMDINKTKEKEARNKQFIKRIGEDVYVDQSVKILQKMILNDNLVKKN